MLFPQVWEPGGTHSTVQSRKRPPDEIVGEQKKKNATSVEGVVHEVELATRYGEPAASRSRW